MGDDSSAYASACLTTPIDSSNIGFQLLKKHGWTEGTGLGASQQGRLEPIPSYLNNNKRGLGSDCKNKNKAKAAAAAPHSNSNDEKHSNAKKMSKKQRKIQELEKRLQEKEFDRAFFREFWPDNV